VTLEQIAADFGIHVMTLSGWLRKADAEDGVKPGATTAQLVELREAKRRYPHAGAGERSAAPSGGASVAGQSAGSPGK
jgi:transposase-like protein